MIRKQPSFYLAHTLVNALLVFCFCFPGTVSASVVDAPHNETNQIVCSDCHSYSLWWRSSPIEADTETKETRTNAVCLSCHGELGSVLEVVSHASAFMVSGHREELGDWSRSCIQCHDPHIQTQLRWLDSLGPEEVYLVRGNLVAQTVQISGNGVDTPYASTFQYENITTQNNWEYATTPWTDKTTAGRGLILTLPEVGPGNTFEIISVDQENSLITVSGQIASVHNENGESFGLLYGQLVRDTIDVGGVSKNVRFFNPNGGFVEIGDSSNGICQVCHTQTLHFRNTGEINVDSQGYDHTSQTGADCVGCHSHTNAFAHGGGAATGAGCGSATECHGTRESHLTHVATDGLVQITCEQCHNIQNFPEFKDGGKLSTTTVCDNCHSANGVSLAKQYWPYPGSSNNAEGSWAEVEGQVSFCGSCHDSTPGNSQNDGLGNDAFNILGDNSSYGFFFTGHGKDAGNYATMHYQNENATGNPAASSGQCGLCHDLQEFHFNAAGKRLLQGFESDQANSNCNQCHPPGSVAIAEPVLYNGSADYESGAHASRLCTECHDVHGAATAEPAMAKGGKRALCLGCHAAENPYGYPTPGNTVSKHDLEDETACSSCHNPHNPAHGEGASGDGCVECHGHEVGSSYDPDMSLPFSGGILTSQGKGSVHSHSTHTETDEDDLKGPAIYCDSCHDLNNMPKFKNFDGSGSHSLAETDICDNCHSPDGSYDGVNDPVFGAKANWQSGIYLGLAVAPGKEEWCLSCHDQEPGYSKPGNEYYGVYAPNVVGDNATYGYYITGHGVNGRMSCVSCHSTAEKHIDHLYSGVSSVVMWGENPTNYRFYPQKGMVFPYSYLATDAFKLCYTCHEEALITGEGASVETNFRTASQNLHHQHVSGMFITCIECHNPHGSIYRHMLEPSFDNLCLGGDGKYYALNSADCASPDDQGGVLLYNSECYGCHSYSSGMQSEEALEAGLALENDGYKDGWYRRTKNDTSGAIVIDLDMDGDGVDDLVDNCLLVPNSGQDDIDKDHIGDACDNCINDANEDQSDFDNDNIGDICDQEPVCGDPANTVWTSRFGTDQGDRPQGVAVDPFGYIYVAGNIETAEVAGQEVFVRKFDASGSTKWVKQFGSSKYDHISGIVVDSQGNSYVTGYTFGDISELSQGATDIFIRKYDSLGNEKWTRQFGTSDYDYANAIAIDSNGNIYLTGKTSGQMPGAADPNNGGTDLFIMKYDQNGNRLWTTQTGTASDESAHGIAVDASGDIHIIGSRVDYHFTEKYDGNGVLVWQNGVSIDGKDIYSISSIATDAVDSFYISVETNNGEAHIIKYNNDKTYQWTETFDPDSGGCDAIALDATGNILVTGSTEGDFGSTSKGYVDIYIRKYDSNRNVVWTAQSGSADGDYGYAMDVDASGYVYVAGYTSGDLGGEFPDEEAFVLKTGDCPTELDQDGVVNDFDNCLAQANSDQADGDSDSIGDVCDTCPDIADADQTDSDYDTIGDLCDPCPNDAGNDFDGDALCADLDNCPNDANPDQIDSDGDGLGDACDICPYDDSNDVDEDAVCTKSDNCPVAYNPGQDDNDSDLLGNECDNCVDTANFDQVDFDLDGIGDACDPACTETEKWVLWSRQTGSSSFEYFSDPAVDIAGNVYVTGATSGSVESLNQGGTDMIIAKYGKDGEELWKKQVGSAGNDYGSSLALDSMGNVYVAGYTSADLFGTSSGNADGFIVKYDSLGNHLWSTQFASTSAVLYPDIKVDQNGNIYVAGVTTGELGGTHVGDYDIFIRKYNSTGEIIFTTQFGSEERDSLTSISVDASGSVYATGTTRGSLFATYAGGYSDIYVVKYSYDGERVWQKQFGTSSSDYSRGIAVDTLGNSYVVWHLSSAINYLRKYSVTGNEEWTTHIGTESVSNNNGIAVDRSGNTYVTGYQASSSSSSDKRIYIWKHDSNSNLLWQKNISPSESDGDESYDIAVGTDGYIYVAGKTYSDLDGEYGPDVLEGSYDAFVAKAGQCPTDTDEDGVNDVVDNCSNLQNTNQDDADNDGLGDVCDPCPSDNSNDADLDGVCGAVDNCPFAANPGQEDSDADGIGDACQ